MANPAQVTPDSNTHISANRSALPIFNRLVLFLVVSVLNIPLVIAQQENSAASSVLPQYQKLQQVYNYYDELASDMHWFDFPIDICLRTGDKSDFVWGIKSNLLTLGDLPSKEYIASNEFDSLLLKAVVRFQERHGLVADGVFGQATIAAMNVPITERMEQIELNIKRWKALDTTLSQPYVMVNIPDFTLQVVDGNQTLLQMRVAVGKNATRTPQLQSSITHVVLNPSWYVPQSIIRNEIIPLQKRDKNYLASHQMKLYTNKSGRRAEVNPDTVNWEIITASKFPYNIEQVPGPNNALGRIKFIFPNNSDVYLHDTPQKTIFQHPVRTYSHGCVRVEKPVELAACLLGRDSERDYKKIMQAIDKGQGNKFIKLPKPIPIAITYITAWVDDEWKLHFRNDVYKYDKGAGIPDTNVSHIQQ